MEKSRKVLAAELLGFIEQKMDLRVLPEKETIEKIISTVRKKVPREEDYWSIGASIMHNISAESSPDLVKILRWCIIVGRRFSVREAKWVDKLRGAVPSNKLLLTAAAYAVEEKVAEALDEVIDTKSLDFRMLCFPDDTVMENKLQFDSRRLGLMPKQMTIRAPEKAVKGAELSPDLLYMEEPVSKAIEKISGSYWHHEEELSEDADTLYALWLRKLNEGTQWDQLSPDSREEIARRLFEEVHALSKKAESHVPWIIRFPEVMNWEPPSDILGKVGIYPDSFEDNTNEPKGG